MFAMNAREHEVDELDAAHLSYAELRAADGELHERHEAMRLALSMATTEGRMNISEASRQRAAPYLKRATNRRPRFIEDLADIREQIEAGKPALNEVREAYHAAQRKRADEIAVDLQGRHRAAVRSIASALEDLSRAVAEEMAVHDELRRRAPLPDSKYLPRLGQEFRDVCLSATNSRAANWARSCRELGILKD